ncbi:hypothetical protein LEP1GSC059_2553 [Leptospira noguchii serovar Panama str. CZ214]|uniref:Uncharacterized protein n=1 Tax=Leptospira noguchii serovar Panama str. CZ214 TaxID=1001595 RepID=T0FTM1_9LEPT|nr:hypothetical protein LEP1GSC059_2553 [Leptospira noguchii serovar Panama str. CZ214]
MLNSESESLDKSKSFSLIVHKLKKEKNFPTNQKIKVF